MTIRRVGVVLGGFLLIGALALLAMVGHKNEDRHAQVAGSYHIVESGDCELDDAVGTCGVVEVEDGGYIEFMEIGAGQQVVIWLPGGPNMENVRLLESNYSLLDHSFPDSRFLTLDPPRTSEGDLYTRDCSIGSEFREFMHALGAEGRNAESDFFSLGCEDAAGIEYGVRGQLDAYIAAIGDFYPEDSILIYASSFDATLAMLLNQRLPNDTQLILDNPVPPGDGEDFVKTQVLSLVAAAERELQDQYILDALEESYSIDPQATSAVLVSALKTSTEEDQSLSSFLHEVIVDTTFRSQVADQYFKRFGDGQYSPLATLHYSGTCTSLDWPTATEYREFADLQISLQNEFADLAKFIFDYYEPCVYWSKSSDGPVLDPPDLDPSVSVLLSVNDALVGQSMSFWPGTYYYSSLDGHRSLLIDEGCIVDSGIDLSRVFESCLEREREE